jgi:hypothetical protein
MSTPPPIACTLSAAEMPARRAEMAALARELVSADAQPARGVLRFRAGPRTRERAAAFVEAEGRCCPFLRMELRDDDPGVLTLTVEGPPGSEPVVGELLAALGAPAR